MDDKEKIRAEIEAKLSATRETINELRMKAEQQQNKYNQVGASSLEEIHTKQTQAEKKLEALTQADQSSWHRHKNDLDRFLEDIDGGLREALAYFH